LFYNKSSDFFISLIPSPSNRPPLRRRFFAAAGVGAAFAVDGDFARAARLAGGALLLLRSDRIWQWMFTQTRQFFEIRVPPEFSKSSWFKLKSGLQL
jgi:hypothetical protein